MKFYPCVFGGKPPVDFVCGFISQVLSTFPPAAAVSSAFFLPVWGRTPGAVISATSTAGTSNRLRKGSLLKKWRRNNPRR
jgi:hypothetical protein